MANISLWGKKGLHLTITGVRPTKKDQEGFASQFCSVSKVASALRLVLFLLTMMAPWLVFHLCEKNEEPHYHMRVWLWHWCLVTNTAWCTTLAYKGIKESVLTRGVQPEENHTYRNIMKLPISGELIKKKLKLWSQQGSRHQFYSLCGDNYLKLIFGRGRFLQNS